jgi:hypothetical protein
MKFPKIYLFSIDKTDDHLGVTSDSRYMYMLGTPTVNLRGFSSQGIKS